MFGFYTADICNYTHVCIARFIGFLTTVPLLPPIKKLIGICVNPLLHFTVSTKDLKNKCLFPPASDLNQTRQNAPNPVSWKKNLVLKVRHFFNFLEQSCKLQIIHFVIALYAMHISLSHGLCLSSLSNCL